METKEAMEKVYEILSEKNGCYYKIKDEYERLKEKSCVNKNKAVERSIHSSDGQTRNKKLIQ